MLSLASRGGVVRVRACCSRSPLIPAALIRSQSTAGPTAASLRPVRQTVSIEQRAAMRAALKEQSTQRLAEAGGQTATITAAPSSLKLSRWMWYLAVGLPGGLLIWGASDENSPPAQFSRMTGLSDLVGSFTDNFAKPSFDKLLPDWSQVSVFFLW